MEIKRLSFKHKNNKLVYYAVNYVRQIVPSSYYQSKLDGILNSLSDLDKKKIISRVNYYNKLDQKVVLSAEANKLSELNLRKARKTYFFDLYEYSRYFSKNLKAHYLFGDITDVPEEPCLLKSRPISGENSNSVLLKWNKIRHFTYVNKDKSFLLKKNRLVWRGKVSASQSQRVRFLEKYSNNRICNIGSVKKNELDIAWRRSRMTISEQLDYKFILSIEGNDVASNLKWVMSSNSIAVMPKPKFETWFMEGRLIPDHHYIAIKDDYSDLERKLTHYINNPDEAMMIIKNANDFVAQFRNKDTEDLISLLVLNKYFEKTNQLE